MRISDSLVIKLLSNSDAVSKEQLEALKNHEQADKKALQYLAVKEGLISEKELTEAYAKEIDIPFIDLDVDSLDQELLGLIPIKTAKKYKAVVIGKQDDGTIEVAMEDPEDIKSTIYLRKLLGQQLKLYVATEAQIHQVIAKLGPAKESKAKKIEDKNEEFEVVPEKITQAVNELVEKAIEVGASDIHIEPRQDVVVTRYRVDGQLREVHKLPIKMLPPLLEEIKLISGLSSSEFELPQSGKFRYESGDQTRTVAVYTMPVMDGEKVVMKIIDDNSKMPELGSLGLWGKSLKDLNRIIAKDTGLVLACGPIGSGRTTTLFSILNKLYSPTVNVATIEDPIEHRINGINQTAVNLNQGISFAIGLKAILDGDPNIIMVGELRDPETAELVIRAAHKGHLVLSAMFTPTAIRTIKHLSDMGVEVHQSAAVLNGIVCQRLVRKLCSCATKFSPSSAMVKRIKTDFDIDGSDLKSVNELEKAAISEGLGTDKAKSASSSAFTINNLWQATEDGCEECDYTGFKGRIGLFEVLTDNEKVSSAIASEKGETEIKRAATSAGMIPMKTDGLIKALRGITTLDEVLRATADA